MIFVLRKKDKIGIIEKLGQKIPDPVIIFILLYILVLVVTGIFGGNTFSMTSADGTSVSYEIKNMFTAENVRWIFSNAILNNWLGYAGGIVGTILIVMFGIGIAEESGLLSALIRRMGTNISDKLLPFVLVFLGIMSNIATDAGYLILIPLAGLLYVGIGKNPQHTARADHPDDVEFLIGLARRTPGSPFEPVFVDPVAEIRQPRITPADLQQAACPGTPDADHRFAFPVVVIEQPAGKHLLGRKSPVAALPAEFHRKILSQGLQRTDTVVVVDIQVAQFRGDLARKRLRQGVSRPGTLYGRRTEDKTQRRLAERRAAQQPPETPAPVAQERQHGNEQQPVPGIGDADAHGSYETERVVPRPSSS